MGLLVYRTTPVAGLEYSPSELLMSRLLRTTLPCVFDKLKPKLPIDVKEKMKTIKLKKSIHRIIIGQLKLKNHLKKGRML